MHIARAFTSTDTQPKSMHLVTKSWKAYAELQQKLVREDAARTPVVAEDAERRADRERVKAVIKTLVYLMHRLQVKNGSELALPNARLPYAILDAQNLGDEHASSICESFEQLGSAFR